MTRKELRRKSSSWKGHQRQGRAKERKMEEKRLRARAQVRRGRREEKASVAPEDTGKIRELLAMGASLLIAAVSCWSRVSWEVSMYLQGSIALMLLVCRLYRKEGEGSTKWNSVAQVLSAGNSVILIQYMGWSTAGWALLVYYIVVRTDTAGQASLLKRVQAAAWVRAQTLRRRPGIRRRKGWAQRVLRGTKLALAVLMVAEMLCPKCLL